MAGEAMHYGFGIGVGALYGVLAELVPAVTARVGLAYASAVWVVADLVTVPLAGFGSAPTKQPVGTHAYALGSHMIYGVALETGRRLLRWFLR